MRSIYLDNSKGILIIFIVLAHVFSLCSSYYGYNDDFFKFCSLFMIPCFFFISAYFSSKSHKKKSIRILKTLKTYLIWQILITCYYAFILKIINFNLNIFIPRYTLWFLVSLTTYYLLDYILEKVSYKIMIPLAFILSLLSGFIPFIGSFLSLARTFTFLPFYVLGYYAKDLDLFNKMKNNKAKWISIIGSIMILILLLVFPKFFPLNLLKGKYNYYDISSNLLNVFLKRILFYICSIIVSIAFFNLVPNKKSILTKLGQNTLYIYLTQGVILKTFVTKKILVSNYILGTIFMFFFLFFCAYLYKRIVKWYKGITVNRGGKT